MDERIEQLTNLAADMLGLNDNYRLARHNLYYDNQAINDTRYILNTEWLPADSEQTDEENPPGTAVVDMDVHAQTLKRVAFVQGQSFADETHYPNPNEGDVIEWLEEVTGLTYGKQFTPAENEGNTFMYHAAVDHIPVNPSGSIAVVFENDHLVSMRVDGHFPDDSEVDWEPFALTMDHINGVAQAQCRRIEIPFEAEEKWLPLYAIEEIFVTNDAQRTIPFDIRNGFGTIAEQDLVLTWEKIDSTAFEPQKLSNDLHPGVEDVFNKTPHPDSLPITSDIEASCIDEVKRYMQHASPDESGIWRLVSLRRENGYIFATLKPVDVEDTSFHRTIQVVLDGTTCEALNAIDNQMLINVFKNFTHPDGSEISAEDAFDKLYNDIEVIPTYVYDRDAGYYVLCGRVDCSYGVEAKTGNVVTLDELNV